MATTKTRYIRDLSLPGRVMTLVTAIDGAKVSYAYSINNPTRTVRIPVRFQGLTGDDAKEEIVSLVSDTYTDGDDTWSIPNAMKILQLETTVDMDRDGYFTAVVKGDRFNRKVGRRIAQGRFECARSRVDLDLVEGEHVLITVLAHLSRSKKKEDFAAARISRKALREFKKTRGLEVKAQ